MTLSWLWQFFEVATVRCVSTRSSVQPIAKPDVGESAARNELGHTRTRLRGRNVTASGDDMVRDEKVSVVLGVMTGGAGEDTTLRFFRLQFEVTQMVSR
jgi:hypothetical protein